MRKKNGGTKNRTTACVAALLTAALLLSGCSGTAFAPTPAPTEAPTPAPTPKPTATPKLTVNEKQIVASIKFDLQLYLDDPNDSMDPTIVSLGDSTYAIDLYGFHSGVELIFLDDCLVLNGSTDGVLKQDGMLILFTEVSGFLLRALLPERDMDIDEALNAFIEWFVDPYIETESTVETQIDGYTCFFGSSDTQGVMLIISY